MVGKFIPLLLIATISARAEPTYTVKDLGTLGGENSRAYAINNAGEVVGESETVSRRIHAFLWRPGAGLSDLGTLGGPTSRAYDINDHSTVVGEAATTSGLRAAFLWTPAGGMTNLGTDLEPYASYAYAVNDADVVAGGADTGDGSRAIAWSNNAPAQLAMKADGPAIAFDVNTAGYLAGQLDRGQPGHRVSAAFIHRPSEPSTTLLPAPGGLSSSATCMNDLNQAAGYVESTGGQTHAFVFDGVLGLRDIDTMSNAYSCANAINVAGAVVGVFFQRRDDDEHAFLFADGAFSDLNDLLAPGGKDWVLIEAADINDAGQIVGYGRLDDQDHAFLLTPVATK